MNAEHTSRYPGLEPFSQEQQLVFFGREDDLAKFFDLVQGHQQVLLYGKSGLGKSSLINAGLMPMLTQRAQDAGENIRILRLRLGSWVAGRTPSPLETIHSALGPLPPSYLDKVIEDEGSLWQHCKALDALGEYETLYLIFDQFEELFSHPANDVTAFKLQLADLLYREVPQHFRTILEFAQYNQPDILSSEELDHFFRQMRIKVIYSIREDRYHELNLLTDYLPDITNHRFSVKPLSKAQAEEAILLPASMPGKFQSKPFTYSQEAISKVLDYLCGGAGQHVETTQLQVLCSHFEGLGKSLVGVEDIPAFDDIFLQFYLKSISALPEREQNRARAFIEDHMIMDGKRIGYHRLACREFLSEKSLNILLSERHLLRAERGSTGETLELAHDTLVGPILLAKGEREALQQAEAEEQERQRQEMERERVEQENRRLQLLVEEKEQARAMEMEARQALRKKVTQVWIGLGFSLAAVVVVVFMFVFALDARKNAEIQGAKATSALKAGKKYGEWGSEAYLNHILSQRKQIRDQEQIIRPLDTIAANYLNDSLKTLDSLLNQANHIYNLMHYE
jgi:hypothetical protein